MLVIYLAIRGLTNDKSGERWEPGDQVKTGDFPKYIIENWLRRGVLVEDKDDGSDGNTRQNGK